MFFKFHSIFIVSDGIRLTIFDLLWGECLQIQLNGIHLRL